MSSLFVIRGFLFRAPLNLGAVDRLFLVRSIRRSIVLVLLLLTSTADGGRFTDAEWRAIFWREADLYTGDSMQQFDEGYNIGRAHAGRDLARNYLAVERYGRELVYADIEDKILLQRFGIHVEHVAGCMIFPRGAGHVRGYNDVSEAEIRRRFGNALEAASREAEMRWEQSRRKKKT